MRLSEAAGWAGGVPHGVDVALTGVSTDSRNIRSGDLFVALQGPRFDGNEYALAAQQAGAVAAMVTRPVDGMPYILVEDARLALGRLAAAWRTSLPITVVGVTGSNGKTTVKEMIAAILGEEGPVWATRGNLNNDIGVPMTLLSLRRGYRYAVVEMGANHPKEIAYLAGLARPDVAVVNNAGAAHLEGFGSLEGVARAKGELVTSLAGSGVAVLNADDNFWPLWRDMAGGRRVIAFGSAADAQVRLSPASFCGGVADCRYASRFVLQWGGREWPMQLALPGLHNAYNAAAAAAAALALGVTMEQAQAGLSKVRPVSGRMQPLMCGDALIFNDTYNANPSSFAVGLDVLTSAPGEHWVVLGGFGELGSASAELHAELGRQAKGRGVSRLFATGPLADRAVESFGQGAVYFEKQEDLIHTVKAGLRQNVVLLVKGSRSQRMERVVEALCGAEAA